MIYERMLNVQKAEDNGENEPIDVHVRGRLITKFDKGCLKVAIPEESVVRTLPEGVCPSRALKGIPMERICQIVGVGKVKLIGVEMMVDQAYKSGFIRILMLE